MYDVVNGVSRWDRSGKGVMVVSSHIVSIVHIPSIKRSDPLINLKVLS